MNKKPKISIVTISYNSSKTIRDTIDSVISQDYDNIEYIIIDGKSTDETIDIIKSYGDKISLLISEEDDGLYVMNPSDEVGVPVTTTSSNVKVLPENNKYFRNISWAPNSERAVFWTYKNNTYFLYLFERSIGKARLLQSGARFGSWYDNSTVTYRSESANKMYMINVTSNTIGDPILIHDSPWADLQPR